MVTVANVSNVSPGIWKLFVIGGRKNAIDGVSTFYDVYEIDIGKIEFATNINN